MQQARYKSSSIFVNGNQLTEIFSNIKTYLYHWPLFAFGLGIAGIVLVGYLQTIKPIYEIKASILIPDQKKAPTDQSPLHEIDLLNSSRIIDNELEILRSKDIMDKVVSDLQLNISYKGKHEFYSTDLYDETPVRLKLRQTISTALPATIRIVPLDGKSFKLLGPDGHSNLLQYNKQVRSDFGTWELTATKHLKEHAGQEIAISVLNADDAARQYQSSLKVELSNKSSTTLMLSINDVVSNRGKDVLNSLIYNYNLEGDQEKARRTKNTLAFIDERLAALATDLNSAEKGIEHFKSTRGLTDIKSKSQISLENLQQNDSQLNEVSVKLSVVEGIEDFINSSHSAEKVPATMGIVDPALSSLVEQLSQLQLQREKLLATTPESNPDFEPINRQIVATKLSIKQYVAGIKSSLLNTRAKLESINNRFESSIKNIPIQERQFINIKRQQEIKEGLYIYLLQKREEISVKYASAFADNRIVDNAYLWGRNNKQKQIALLAALLLGIGLPAGIIYFRRVLKPKITSVFEIADAVDIPIISELSFSPVKNLVALHHSNLGSAIAEQIRTLRIKLRHPADQQDGGRVTLITSSLSGEGKSFVSVNLALSMGQVGRKTIILEMDFFRPKMAKIFNLNENHLGVTDFLNGSANIGDIIQTLDLNEPIDVITSGSNFINSSGLLESERLDNLIMYLRSFYDYIIIDTAPVHLVPDAIVISRFVDKVLYVIRQGHTYRTELSFIHQLFIKNVLGRFELIFNGINPVKYGYGEGNDQSYYHTKQSLAIFSDFKDRF